MLICLDAGHGGKDPGAVGQNGTREKDITLQMVRGLRRVLQRRGFSVCMTRDRDEYIGLTARALKANAQRAALFVSIHCNAYTNPKTNGWEIWTSTGETGADSLASHIQSAWAASFQGCNIRGMKEKNFTVLARTKMPAVLVELGFISNYREEGLLQTPKWQKQACEAIAQGIISYTEQG